MNFLTNMMGAIFNVQESSFANYSWLLPIVKFLESLLIPITIILAVAGAIWVIVLGVQLARAESADKASEAKKRLINVAVAIVAIIVFIWLLSWFASQVPTIFGTEKNPLGGTTTGTESGSGSGSGGSTGFITTVVRSIFLR